jgi:hypothetical protein
MLDHTDALPPALERAGEAPWRQAVTPSVQDRCDLPEFNKCEVGRDAYPASDHRAVGIGSVVVASIWLAFYVIAAAHSLASGN